MGCVGEVVQGARFLGEGKGPMGVLCAGMGRIEEEPTFRSR